jgi:hypothetical protein
VAIINKGIWHANGDKRRMRLDKMRMFLGTNKKLRTSEEKKYSVNVNDAKL